MPRAVSWIRSALLPLALLLAGCDAASGAVSATALLRVEAAQLVPGDPPADPAGPGVQGVMLAEARIWPGQVDKVVSGVLQEGATAAALQLLGDRVHYIVAAAAPDVTAPQQPTFFAHLGFSRSLPLGPQQLLVQAVSAEGRYGPALRQHLDAVAEPGALSAAMAQLVIVLRWDRQVDLDLHVEEPGGQVIWSRRKAGAPGAGVGVLDLDSNQACVLDGRQREQVSYAQPPPGRYRVLVDTFSLCGQATAYWSVEVYQGGASGSGARLAAASGQSLPSDTRGDHGALSGVLALELALP